MIKLMGQVLFSKIVEIIIHGEYIGNGKQVIQPIVLNFQLQEVH